MGKGREVSLRQVLLPVRPTKTLAFLHEEKVNVWSAACSQRRNFLRRGSSSRLYLSCRDIKIPVMKYTHIVTIMTPPIHCVGLKNFKNHMKSGYWTDKIFAVSTPINVLWNNQQMQIYAVNFIPLLSSLYMFRAPHTPIIRSTMFNCIYSHWYKP